MYSWPVHFTRGQSIWSLWAERPKKYSQDEINTSIKRQYYRRLAVNGIKTDPKSLPSYSWTDDIQEWPEIDIGKIFSYILSVKAIDADYVGKYKYMKAYAYCMSGFVDTSLSQNALLTTSSLFEMQCAATIEVVEWSTSGVGLYWGCQKWLPYCHILVHMHGWTREVCNHVIALLNKVTYAFKKDYVFPATKFASWRMHCCLAAHCSRTIPCQRWGRAARRSWQRICAFRWRHSTCHRGKFVSWRMHYCPAWHSRWNIPGQQWGRPARQRSWRWRNHAFRQ